MEDAAAVKMTKTIYVLYLIGFIFPICTIIGVVFAYIYQDDAKDFLKSHFQYQIRGFWMYVLYYVISLVLCLVIIGWFLLLLTALWWIIRNAKGLRSVMKAQPITNPSAWFF